MSVFTQQVFSEELGILMKPGQRNSARIFVEIAFALSAALACQAVLAQEETAIASENMEEITVYGEKSWLNLRSEWYNAEEDFFAVFNSLNSRDDFDINCEFLTPLGERRRYHVCAPQFAKSYQAAASAEYILSLNLAKSQKEIPDFSAARSGTFSRKGLARTKEELMLDEMASLLSENPEMREALSKVVKAKNRYEGARQQE